jgi:DNA modification methylase
MLEDIVENLFSFIDIWPESREDVLEYVHPTQKPIAVYERPLKRVSFEGDIVLDLFGGSGSLLMACEQLNRIAYIMEIDPYYCQVIINRWEQFTGNKAVRLNGD